ncbi:MAG: transcriptional regulator [Actinomycetota bacterium]|nr:transcriptional regulator [Actinomycetota bacterium]
MPRTPETPAGGPAWMVQAAEIARLFYFEGQSKVQIADQLRLSRFKVARILDEARERGLVEVTMRFPAAIDTDLSVRLARHLGIERSLVLAGEADDATTRAELGVLVAGLLTEIVSPDDVLGLTCSRTVTATTEALQRLAPCDVLQLSGTLAGMGHDVGSVESVRRAAQVGGGIAHPIYAPLVVQDAETAASLARQPGIRATLDRVGDVTVAVVAIGAWRAGYSTVWDAVSVEERKQTAAAGAIGEIGGRCFDEDGNAVRGPVDDRVVGMTLEQLRSVPHVVAIAYGEGRSQAVRAVARSGTVHTLVCDAAIAAHLLAQPPLTSDEEAS